MLASPFSIPKSWLSGAKSKKVANTKNAPLQPRLIRLKPNPRSGRKHASSSSNRMIDYAAAVEAGLIPRIGIMAAFPEAVRLKAKRLLKNNQVVMVQPTESRLAGNHETTVTRQRMADAIMKVIGPQYWEENKHLGANAFSGKLFTQWVTSEIADPKSRLNHRLLAENLPELCELPRSRRWWLDRLSIRKSAE